MIVIKVVGNFVKEKFFMLNFGYVIWVMKWEGEIYIKVSCV